VIIVLELNASNCAVTTLGMDITADATTLDVYDASKFPSPPFRATLFVDDPANGEIIEVGSVASLTFYSLLRGQEGTTAQSWEAGTKIRATYTADMHDQIKNNIDYKPYYNHGTVSGAISLDFSHTCFHEMTLGGDGTIGMASSPAIGRTIIATLIIHHGSGANLSWNFDIVWEEGAPDCTEADGFSLVQLRVTG
jgi:hypothetical protein